MHRLNDEEYETNTKQNIHVSKKIICKKIII